MKGGRTSGVAPEGSPFGFTSQDWSLVDSDRADSTRLIVCFGYQWRSEFYDSNLLRANIEIGFHRALTAVAKNLAIAVMLDFRSLQGGYGSHLFNEIARNIISADIGVFDASDHNPNVMIELGVALTWGRPVLPIRERRSPVPPSDISGQTWAEYLHDASAWTDTHHHEKLERMVENAVRLKISLDRAH